MPDPAMREVRLSPARYRALAAFITAAIRVGDDGGPIVIPGAHYDAHDIFLEANGHYSIFETCNEWTRQALAGAGVRVPVWSPFEQALFYQLPQGSTLTHHPCLSRMIRQGAPAASAVAFGPRMSRHSLLASTRSIEESCCLAGVATSAPSSRRESVARR